MSLCIILFGPFFVWAVVYFASRGNWREATAVSVFTAIGLALVVGSTLLLALV